LDQPLRYRCLALTGSFETNAPWPECFAAVAGDFDGQGLSLGALQWNFGQGTLQVLLREMDASHPQVMQEIFGDSCPRLRAVLQATREEQIAWAQSLEAHWRDRFRALGLREEFQSIQVQHSRRYYQSAVKLAGLYGLTSERAVALMFDIKVQNGGISAAVRSQIERDFATVPNDDEVARLRIVADRRAAAANPRWVEDVRSRKLTIANGEGAVHGRHYKLEEQYGIGLRPAKLDSSPG